MAREGLPFAGVRVLDAAGAVAPACGLLLRMFGADVYLVETSADGHGRRDLNWTSFNAGKLSLTFDFSSPGERAALRRLIEQADILVDDGLDLAGLSPREINPSLIHVRITPFGLEGPASAWLGPELIAQAAGGLLFASGDQRFPPALTPIPVGACMAGAQAAVAALLSLRQREATGLGDTLDVSVQEATASLMVGAITSAFVTKAPRSRAPSTLTSSVPEHRYYESSDGGLVAWSLTTGPGFGALNKPAVAWLQEEGGGQSLAGIDFEQISSHNLDESRRREWLDEFRSFYKGKTKAELVREAVRRRIMLHPLSTMEDVLNDDVLAERDVFTMLNLPDGATVRAAGRPLQSTAYLVSLPPDVPALGSSNDKKAEAWRQTRGPAVLRHAPEPEAKKPLAGVRVLDFSWIVAGPVTGKWLALAGADVLKVESRKRPDPNRMTGPFPLGKPFIDGSAQYPNNNANKRSVAIDIAHPKARVLLLALAEKADIVIENFSAGVMDRHGIGYDELKRVNPGIIMISMSLQGQTGSRAHQPGVGSHVQMRSGLDSITGFPGSEPGGPAVFLPDLLGPWVGLTGLLGALEHRANTGFGQYIDLSQYEAMLLWMQPAISHRELFGTEPPRRGNASETACPHGVFPVHGEERWIAIVCEDDGQWARFLELLPPLVRQRLEPLASLANRQGRRAQIESAIEEWTAEQDGFALMSRLQDCGIPAYVVNNAKDLLDDAQMNARSHCRFLEHSILGPLPVEMPAFRPESWSLEPISLGPLYASGTAEALHQWLGLDDDAITELVVDSVINFE